MLTDMPNNDDLPSALPQQVQAAPVNSVAIKAPSFTTKIPVLFFYTLEAQFEIRNPKVTESSTKFFGRRGAPLSAQTFWHTTISSSTCDSVD